MRRFRLFLGKCERERYALEDNPVSWPNWSLRWECTSIWQPLQRDYKRLIPNRGWGIQTISQFDCCPLRLSDWFSHRGCPLVRVLSSGDIILGLASAWVLFIRVSLYEASSQIYLWGCPLRIILRGFLWRFSDTPTLCRTTLRRTTLRRTTYSRTTSGRMRHNAECDIMPNDIDQMRHNAEQHFAERNNLECDIMSNAT